jgi:uncharacterized protein (TIGR02001 family)
MGRTLLVRVLGGLVLQIAVAPPAFSQAADWGGSVSVATDYVYRGISQTRGQSALQGGLQVTTAGGWSASIWGSTVDFTSGAGDDYEIDLQLARTWTLSPDWAGRLGLTHYAYPEGASLDYDYDELTGSLSYQGRVTASVSWSPNSSRWGDGHYVHDREAFAYELTLLQPLGMYWSVYAGAGYYDLDDLFGTGYAYWNAGLAFTWAKVQVDVMHVGSDDTAKELFGYEAGGDRWTAALSWHF